jgi:hypothetical protein
MVKMLNFTTFDIMGMISLIDSSSIQLTSRNQVILHLANLSTCLKTPSMYPGSPHCSTVSREQPCSWS